MVNNIIFLKKYMKQSIHIQLLATVFFEFFIGGSWLVTMETYLDKVLHADGIKVGLLAVQWQLLPLFHFFLLG